MNYVTRRLLGFFLSLCLILTLIPISVSAAGISAKTSYTDPAVGDASPASEDGSVSAVPYTYSDNSLWGDSQSWFSYSGEDEIEFEAEFITPTDINDYGWVEFSADAPYITYTPSAEVENQTVQFKVTAKAGAESITGDFYWTVHVGPVPDSNVSDNTNLSELTYQVEDGEPVVIDLEEGVFQYEVSLSETDLGKTVTLSGVSEDTEAVIQGDQITAGYSLETASLTVTAANNSTTQTYQVAFAVKAGIDDTNIPAALGTNISVAEVTIGEETTAFDYGENADYETAEAALEAAFTKASGKTAAIKLLENVEVTKSLVVSDPNSYITLEMSDNINLSGSLLNYGVITVNNGKLILKNGIIKNTYDTTENRAAYGVYVKGGNFTMTGGEIVTNTYCGLYVEGEVSLEGGTIKGPVYGVFVNNFGIVDVSKSTQILCTRVTGGSTGVTCSMLVYGSNSQAMINGGSFLSSGDCGIYVGGKAEINDGTFQGGTCGAFVGANGNITIKGGTFQSPTCGINVAGNATIMGGSFKMIEGNSTLAGGKQFGIYVTGNAEISGGTASGGQIGLAISYSQSGTTKVTLSGGTFSGSESAINTNVPNETVKDYLDTTQEDKYFAYYQVTQEGESVKETLIIDDLDKNCLTDTITVKECTHVENDKDGLCDICGAYMDNVGAKLFGYTLSLSGNIGVNFYMELSQDVVSDEGAYMQFTLPGANHTKEKVMVSEATQKTVDGKGYYVFPCGVAAKDMTGQIKAQIVLSNGTKGEEYNYSVKEYADYIIANPEKYAGSTDSQDDLLNLVKALLNYGGYTQTYFNTKTDCLANAGLEKYALPELNEVLDALKDNYTYSSANIFVPDGLIYYGTSLMLTTESGIRHYFTLEEEHGIEEYTFSVEGQTLTPVQKGNYYYVEIPNISAKNLGDKKILEIKVANTDDATASIIEYSAYHYVNNVLSSEGHKSSAYGDLLRALYQYGEAAKKYFVQTNMG